MNQGDYMNQLANGQMNAYGQVYTNMTPVQQLEKRAGELQAFLAIDHDTKRREAQDELSRILNALECLRAK